MKKLLLAAVALALSCCAVNAQGVPNGGGMGVPNTAIPQWLLNTFANVVMYGAPANTKRVQANVTATTGSPNVTISGQSFSSGDVSKDIVIAGLGPDVAQSAAIAAGGAGNAAGDVLTLSAPGCTTPPQLTVTQVSSGAVVTAVPTTPGSCAVASLPANPVSVASSTGAGTGSTYNLTWAASALPTTISSVTDGTHIVLGVNSQQTISSQSEWVSWGNDDAPYINLALSSGANSVIFPAFSTYGIYSVLNLPHESRIKFDCNGSMIVALASMGQMLLEAQPTGFFNSQGSSVSNCRLDGMGVAQQNISHNAFGWMYLNNIIENATVGNLNVAGSGENTRFIGNSYRNDATVVGNYPLYNVSANFTDNQFTDEIGNRAINNFIDNSNGNYWTNIHGYNSLDTQFIFNGTGTFATQVYADTVPANVPGFKVNGTLMAMNGWRAYSSAGGTGAQGVYIATQNGQNLITGGVTQNISTLNVITRSWNLYTTSNNIVVNNFGSAYTNSGGASNSSVGGGDGSVCWGYAVSCNGGNVVALGVFVQGAFQGVSIGNNSNGNKPGAASIGVGASDNNAVHFAYSPALVQAIGKNQYEVAVVSGAPAAASAARLTSDGAAASTQNTMNLPNNSTTGYSRCEVTAWDFTNIKAALFTVDGLIVRRGASVGTTALVGTPTITLAQADSSLTTAGLSSTSLAISADTANGGVNFTLTAPTGIAMRATAHCAGASVQ